jgi:hypothetical protein
LRLQLDDAEEQQQDDDQPRHAEDPKQKRNQQLPPFLPERAAATVTGLSGVMGRVVNSGSRKGVSGILVEA